MSNAIAQSATKLAVSNSAPDWSQEDFNLCAKKCAERSAKGTTRERQMLNYNKLVSAVCVDYRAHYPALYGRTDRLPSDVFDKVEKAVTLVITEALKRVNVNNVISFRRGFYHNTRDMEITERVASTGENTLPLNEQLLGVDLFIGAANKRLKALEAKTTPNFDLEKDVKATIMRLEVTRAFIMREIDHQKSAQPEIK